MKTLVVLYNINVDEHLVHKKSIILKLMEIFLRNMLNIMI